MFNWINIGGKLDIEKTGYITTNNYKFANQIWFKNFCFGFYFPVFLQTLDFYFQKVEVDNFTGEITFGAETLIDDTNKIAEYFEQHELATDLSAGYYVIIAKSGTSKLYTTSSIFEVKNTYFTGDNYIRAVDVLGYIFTDVENYQAIEN